jgi:hypothetical protein
MSQIISAQGNVYRCLTKDQNRLVLVGVAERRAGIVRLSSPLPGRIKERLSGRRWTLAYVDQSEGLSYYQRG